MQICILILNLFLVVLLFPSITFSGGEKFSNDRCLPCHSVALKGSVHSGKLCTDCHFDVAVLPHILKPGKVKCVHCHYKGNPAGVPESDKYLEYENSVHGVAAWRGNKSAPACQDCHGAHDIAKAHDPGSKVSRFNVAKVCGRCHADMYAQFEKSIHGQILLNGKNQDVPTCTGCHGEHNITSHLDPKSKTYASNVSKTCSDCHAKEQIVSKYGIEATRVETFKETFHGVATTLGLKTVANCASCHGVHNILQSNDPESQINDKNISTTCGQSGCHPGASADFTKGDIHVSRGRLESGFLYWLPFVLKWFAISIIAGLVIHIILDINSKLKKRG